jgi:hypothetical protein
MLTNPNISMMYMCRSMYFSLAIYLYTDGTQKRPDSTKIFKRPICRNEGKTKHSYVVQILGMPKGLKSTTSLKMCTGKICQK